MLQRSDLFYEGSNFIFISPVQAHPQTWFLGGLALGQNGRREGRSISYFADAVAPASKWGSLGFWSYLIWQSGTIVRRAGLSSCTCIKVGIAWFLVNHLTSIDFAWPCRQCLLGMHVFGAKVFMMWDFLRRCSSQHEMDWSLIVSTKGLYVVNFLPLL